MDEYRSSASSASFPITSTRFNGIERGHRADSAAFRHRSSSAPRPSTAPAHKGRDSIQTTTSSSLYPASTSSADTPSTSGSLPVTPAPLQNYISDADDVSFRLKLLLRNNYFLPPAHTKPVLNLSNLDVPLVDDSPKKSPISPSFSALFKRARKERSLPEVRQTNAIHEAPLKPVLSPIRPSTPRVVIIREPIFDIREAAIQSEQREDIRRQHFSTPPIPEYFDLDPTDTVDIDPIIKLNHQPSNLSAGAMAARVPPTPDFSSLFDDSEGAWRRALLEEAVGLSMSSIPPPTPVRSPASRTRTPDPSAPVPNSRSLSVSTSQSVPVARAHSTESVPTPRSKRDLGQRFLAEAASTSSLPYFSTQSVPDPASKIGQPILAHPSSPSPSISHLPPPLTPVLDSPSPGSFFSAHSHPPSPISLHRVDTPPVFEPLAPPPRRQLSQGELLTSSPSRARSPSLPLALPIARFSPALVVEAPDGEVQSLPSMETVSSGSFYSDDDDDDFLDPPEPLHDPEDTGTSRTASMSLSLPGSYRHSFETFGRRSNSESMDGGGGEEAHSGRTSLASATPSRRAITPRSTLAPPSALEPFEPPPASPASFFDQVEAQAMDDDSGTETETETLDSDLDSEDDSILQHGDEDDDDGRTVAGRSQGHRAESSIHSVPPSTAPSSIPLPAIGGGSELEVVPGPSAPMALKHDNPSLTSFSTSTSTPYSALDRKKPLTNAPLQPRQGVFSFSKVRNTTKVIEEEQFERLKYSNSPLPPSPPASSATARFYTVGNASEVHIGSGIAGGSGVGARPGSSSGAGGVSVAKEENDKELLKKWTAEQQAQDADLRKLDGMLAQHIETEREVIKKITSGLSAQISGIGSGTPPSVPSPSDVGPSIR